MFTHCANGKAAKYIAKDQEPSMGHRNPIRDEAIAKKNCKQESSAIKAMKQCANAAMDAGAGRGAVVSLKVDYCTHSHAPRVFLV